jgi:hypothetical protein
MFGGGGSEAGIKTNVKYKKCQYSKVFPKTKTSRILSTTNHLKFAE